ncbi:hypothetical protein B0H17DRAFT_1146346 [Mycena rosella]|uniref:Uncharacterized protein n=1 Tax=Mycena rosella TaxID=1033263 RepID=A0AAD7CP55_MYCRO|nr:hypothetical protein B0H17DRAFT_1146346 [Mycena rosella]
MILISAPSAAATCGTRSTPCATPNAVGAPYTYNYAKEARVLAGETPISQGQGVERLLGNGARSEQSRHAPSECRSCEKDGSRATIQSDEQERWTWKLRHWWMWFCSAERAQHVEVTFECDTVEYRG